MSKHEFSPEQKEVIETFGQGLAVLAGAGSGKTTTLVAKCCRLLERDPKARFAAVSFTERSASDLRAKLAELLSEKSIKEPSSEQSAAEPRIGRRVNEDPLAHHWVMTIHGLCAAIIGDFPGEAAFDGDETMLSEPEARALWDRAVRSLWEDGVQGEVREAVDHLLNREGRPGLSSLLIRTRGLASFGAVGRLLESEDHDARALGIAVRFALERYARLKQRQGAMDFDDLERGADRALEHAHVRKAFHERFALVLVDEFQDTNPVQARLIRKFARPDASNLCVVGDPKQSIYRFRDADVGVFEDFCAQLPRTLKLSWNFRSRPGIIEYANGICAEAFAESALTFEPLIPKRESRPQLEPVIRLDIDSPDSLAAWVREEQSRGVPLEKMALLLRRIRGSERWLKALSRAGIPIAIGSGGLFWEDPRIREVVALLKAWSSPANSISAATFLRAPWVGVSDDAIDGYILGYHHTKGGEAPLPLLDTFLASPHPLALRLAPLRKEIVRPAEILAALLEEEIIERDLGAQILGLWHRVEDLSLRGLDFQEVVAELSGAVEEKRRERDVPPPQGEGARGQLSVLTLHGSKGLEFEHVILIDFGKKGRAQDMPLLFWDREKGAYLGARDAEGDRERESPKESPWREDEKRKQLAESKRLFYVALTRARERLILVCPRIEEKTPKKLSPEAKIELSPYAVDYWRGWIDAYGAVPEILVDGRPAAPGQLSLFADSRPRLARGPGFPKAPVERPRHSVTEWTLLSHCPRAYEWRFIRPRVGLEVENSNSTKRGEARAVKPGKASGPDRRELGSRVHAYLEHGDFEGLSKLEAEVGSEHFRAEGLRAWAETSEWMRAPDPACAREVWRELAFEAKVRYGDGGSSGAEVLVGSIDRLIREERDGEARFTILDFKITGRPRSPEELREAYQTQIDLYAWAVEALDPTQARVEAALIAISPETVEVVKVEPRPGIPERLAAEAARIVAGEAGRPEPGSVCRHCEFREICPDFQSP